VAAFQELRTVVPPLSNLDVRTALRYSERSHLPHPVRGILTLAQ
jgi:hypothetical protein